MMAIRVLTLFVAVAAFAGCDQKQRQSQLLLPPAEDPKPTVSGLDGQTVDPFATKTACRVFVFVTTDCPIANRYSPKLSRMARQFAERDVEFNFVYPNKDDTVEDIRKHRQEYSLTSRALRDPDHTLVQKVQATVTPEAAVFDSNDQLVYCGRIDDWYVEFGKNRREATVHDLSDAIEAVLSGKPVKAARVEAIGCYIPE